MERGERESETPRNALSSCSAPMDFQVVVLAGGASKKLIPLISKEVPKALLPVANRPVLSYVLELLEQSNLKDLIVVVEGQDAAVRVGGWISGAYVDRLHVEVAAVPEDVGTAGALRAIARHLTAKDIMVVNGDLVSDVPPGAVAAAHRRHDAAVTAMLCSAPVSGPSESGSSGGKDKTKKPGRYNIIGLDPTKQFLLYIATGAELEKDIRIQKSILRAVGQMEIRADLMDAHLYAFKRSVLQEVLDQKDTFQSLKQDVLPYLVRSQLKSEVLLNGAPQAEENGNEKVNFQKNQVMVSRILANASTPSFHEFSGLGTNGSAPRTHKCCVYIASNRKYCARLNSIQAFSDINRDVTGEASHLSGYSFSAQNNNIHPSAELGSKTTVGPHCMLGEGSQMGDKCSVKRSVIGRHCRIGSNVKVANSVIMNHVTIGDGCSIQGSVICSNVQLQERVVLKDCQVGAGFVVTAGSECKGEALAKKEK
ncbi:translation initiation factor eIF-2B subunit gamma [Juglans regia]|uniref:Translation initiation factor eIF2B subunit gamma n=2 Tax=Juglans regia TaxID=51240 RepID=A0A2I4FN69_JUGRE|nr:translation initiation factor eIF-2B subunit gamma [Juglans regia]